MILIRQKRGKFALFLPSSEDGFGQNLKHNKVLELSITAIFKVQPILFRKL